SYLVFGGVFRFLREPFGNRAVFRRGSASGRGAFHWLGGDVAIAVDAEEEVRREGKYVVSGPCVKEGAVVDRLSYGKTGVQIRWSFNGWGAKRECEIELIDIPGAYPAVNLFNTVCKSLFVQTEVDFGCRPQNVLIQFGL